MNFHENSTAIFQLALFFCFMFDRPKMILVLLVASDLDYYMYICMCSIVHQLDQYSVLDNCILKLFVIGTPRKRRRAVDEEAVKIPLAKG